MADQPQPPEQPRETYDLEPEESTPPPPQRPKIEAPGVLEGFEEDADFERDPELERAVTGKAAASTVFPDEAAELPDFVRPGAGGPKVWAIVGGVLLLAAMIATAVTTQAKVLGPVLTLYNTLLHTGTGVVAVFLAGHLTEHRVGRVELAAARMFAAVAAFSLIFHLRILLIGNTKIEETILGVVAYLVIVVGTFRIWRERLFFVVGSHFILWMLVQVGMALSAAVARANAVPPAP